MYARLRELYDGEVRYTDQVLAPLLTSLHESGNWLIVLVSDHGEEFGEHGSLNHAHSLHEELTHIPFAMAGPGLPTGRTIPSLASIVDVAPTLLGALEIPIPSEWQGRNLLAGDEERGPVFAENFFKSEKHESIMPDFRQLAIWRDGMKLIKNRAMGESTEELYDLELDPGETTASAVEDAEWSATLSQMIADYLALEGADAEEVEDLSESDRRSLEALGYVE
jgi:arylsulfatase A-like enzyme